MSSETLKRTERRTQDFALSLKPWELPLKFSLSDTLTGLILPAQYGQREKLGWQARDFLLSLSRNYQDLR